jgi:lipopolysaccharide transport system permease protein
MSAAYSEPLAKLDPATRRAHVEFAIQDDSAEPWAAEEGWAAGFHLFDAESGTLIVDGARAALNLKPGESARLSFDVDIPEEDGRYQIVFSPMREGVCWYYDRGWPFVLVEADVRNGAVDLGGPRIRTRSALSRGRTLRSLARAFTYPFLTTIKNRGLIRVMVRRDILGRYRGSFGGSFWTVFNPLLLMLTYFFVFGVVLRDEKADKTDFAFYFLSGMLPWLAFSEAVGRAPTLLLEHKNFVKKLVFAVETLPVNLVAAGLVTEFFAIVLYTAFLGAIRHTIPAAMLWLPALLIPQILFTAGICWFLSALGAFVRDLGQIIGFLLTVWFFITPICYRSSRLEAVAPWMLHKNPIYILVNGYRAVFLDNQPPLFSPLWKLWLLSFAVCILGHAWFYKLRKSFPDVL